MTFQGETYTNAPYACCLSALQTYGESVQVALATVSVTWVAIKTVVASVGKNLYLFK